MDIFALYLPQFHQIPENDEWWGKGFTEWDNVRKARPLFPGHIQPIHPLNNEYYDLTDSSVLVKQAELAKDYDLAGFVFFHYWSKGALLLEKPVELWLNTPAAAAEFCLCWANHPWTRSWDGKDHQVLWEQTYGGVEEWSAHLDYLLPFFQDPRYKLIDNKPVLFLYNSSHIPDVDIMVQYWQSRLVEEGFSGIYLVEYISSKNPEPNCSSSLAVYEDEPLYSLRFETTLIEKASRYIRKLLRWPEYHDYRHIWNLILKKKRRYSGRSIVRGAFVAWDNSPRRGRRGPMIVKGSSALLFGDYLKHLIRDRRNGVSDEILIINAWNEWGEGAVLEPSEEYGFAYLEAVREAKRSSEPHISKYASTGTDISHKAPRR